jgi:hypothetical protein
MKPLGFLLLCLVLARPQKGHFDPPPHFIAMEYKGMSNCIYKVYVTDSLIFAARVNGYISVQPNFGMGTSIPKEKMHDPESYVNSKMDRYDNLLSDHNAFLNADKENFIIQKSEVTRVYHDPSKKWGMGYYPHVGKIEIEAIKTPMNRKGNRELILVGDQRPDAVLALLK